MTDHAPVCSICIANYNGVGLIEECLASVAAQSPAIRVEIIVHDDASTDASVSLLRTRYPHVRLIASDTNVGYCVANNRMAEVASGRYLMLLNNDATLLPDALETLMAEALRLETPAILTLPQFDHESGTLLDMGARLDPFLNAVPNHDPGRDIAMVAGACLWIDRGLWMTLGGFPEWFGSVAEDLYLCCLARLRGHPVRALATSGYRHRVGASFGGGKVRSGRLVSSFRRRSLTERNKTFAMIVLVPSPLVQLLLPIHLVLLGVEGMLLSLLNWRADYLTRIYWPVLPALWRERWRLRAARRKAMDDAPVALGAFLGPFDPVPYKLRMLVKHGLPRLR